MVAVPVAFFSKEIIQVLFSSAYADAGPLLAILIWTGVFTSLGAARNVFIVSKNWTRVNLISIALGCALNILLNYVLIPALWRHGCCYRDIYFLLVCSAWHLFFLEVSSKNRLDDYKGDDLSEDLVMTLRQSFATHCISC